MTKGWFLDSGNISDIINSKALFEELAEFHWQYYSELTFQRNQIREQLRNSLREKASSFEFQNWQRVVKYKYSLDPLGAKGSLVDPGGRSTLGKSILPAIPCFPRCISPLIRAQL